MKAEPVMPETPKKSNTGLIIGIVIVVLLCCCCVTGALLWRFGDQLIQSFNSFSF
jgi:hypothetical protein